MTTATVISLEEARAVQWPDPESVPIVNQRYRTPDGDFVRTTSVIKSLGLGAEGLISWAARIERAACFTAAGEVVASNDWDGTPAGIVAALEARLGHAREHQKQLEKAGDIGTAIHALCQTHVAFQLTGQPIPAAAAKAEVLTGYRAWCEWWGKSSLVPLRAEQPVWDPVTETAGTVDLLAWHPARGVGIIDYKSSKGIYDSHHIQVGHYARMASRWTPISWCQIVRLPKSLTDPGFEVRSLGHLGGGKTWNATDLEVLFDAARAVYLRVR